MSAPSVERDGVIGELRYQRLLVAIDASPSSDLALSAAVTAARRDNAAITLIAVAPDVNHETAAWLWAGAPPWTQDEADDYAAQALRDAIARIPEDIPVTSVVRRGRAGEQIVAGAKESNFDAIILGARGVGRVEAMLGSVSQYVMHHADIPVIVAHAPRRQ